MAERKAAGRLPLLSSVLALESHKPASFSRRLSSGMGAGVVVASTRGALPSLRANMSMSQTSTPARQRAISSHQAA